MIATFGFITFGYRVEGLITHAFCKERLQDFEELLFHDIVTVLLFLGYLYGNMLPLGTLVVIVHDVTDAPLHFCKALYASIFKTPAKVLFFASQLLWLYFRLLCFPALIRALLRAEFPLDRADFNPFLYLGAGFLGLLLLLHALWFCMFQRMNLAVLRKSSIDTEKIYISNDYKDDKQ